jgi:hypothetical protein
MVATRPGLLVILTLYVDISKYVGRVNSLRLTA